MPDSRVAMNGEYRLFEGPLDFGGFLFSRDDEATGDTAARPETPRCPDQWAIPPRPIVKTELDLTHPMALDLNHPMALPATTTTTITTSGGTTITMGSSINDRAVGKRGRLRSSSCSSGGSDGGQAAAGGIQCAFCKRNGETREFYSTHILKDWRGMVVCPVLRAYSCPRCGATGDQAHTESHCPLSGNEPSLMATLRTQRRSCGKKAYSWKHQ